MTIQSDNLLSLRSMKAQLEVGLIYLRRRHGELQRQLALAESQERRGSIHRTPLLNCKRQFRNTAFKSRGEGWRSRRSKNAFDPSSIQSERGGAAGLLTEHDQVTSEIAQIRGHLLEALREMAGPLRRYEQLAEQKNQLADEISARTGRNQAYTNYIESALFRQNEYVDDVRYVVEALKRQRVVA